MSNTSEDKDWASKYLLGPLTSPEPSQLMGPGTHFGSVMDRKATPPPYPTPPTSANPSPSTFSSRNPFRRPQPNQAFPDLAQGEPVAKSNDKPLRTGYPRSRTGSLGQRYPGDDSHRPLDMIRKHTKAADRAPHLKKKHLPRADMIDSLDASMERLYHHEGPYDATLLSRNMEKKFSPVEAVRGSNEEALKATPRENIRDALDKHVPLHGTAMVPPGTRNEFGDVYDYTEGADLMREPDAPGGAYKRWDGVKYLPEDYKGKGEPSFSYERAMNKNPQHRRIVSEGSSAFEMQPTTSRLSHQRSTSGGAPELRRSPANNSMVYSEFERDMRRSNSVGRKFGDGLKRRLGSLRRNKKSSEE